MAASIRKAHEELLEGITTGGRRRQFRADDEKSGSGKQGGRERGDRVAAAVCWKLQAEANLLAGLLIESSMATESVRLPAAARGHRRGAGQDRKQPQSACRSRTAEKPARSLRPARRHGGPGWDHRRTCARIAAAACGPSSHCAATQTEAVKLKRAVDSLVEQQGKDAEVVSARARRANPLGPNPSLSRSRSRPSSPPA